MDARREFDGVGTTRRGGIETREVHERVHRTLERMVRVGEVPGIQYVAVDAERTLVDAHLGMSDVSTGVALGRSTLLLTYSVTKIVTAIAAMHLVEAGRLALDTPLDDVFRDHPYGPGIRVGSLLAHTAGVPNPLPLDWFVAEGAPHDRDAALRRVLERSPRLRSPVDEAYHYSNIGYWLLEKVIEAVSGDDFARYVDDRIFGPVGVTSANATFEPSRAAELATGHSRRFTPTNALLHLLSPSFVWAAPHGGWSRAAHVRPIGRAYGGLYASAFALASLMQDLIRDEPRLLSVATRDTMFRERRTRSGSTFGGTLGWVVGTLEGESYVGKQGGGLGFHANVRAYPRLRLATVAMANRTEIAPGPIDARSDRIDRVLVDARRRGAI